MACDLKSHERDSLKSRASVMPSPACAVEHPVSQQHCFSPPFVFGKSSSARMRGRTTKQPSRLGGASVQRSTRHGKTIPGALRPQCPECAVLHPRAESHLAQHTPTAQEVPHCCSGSRASLQSALHEADRRRPGSSYGVTARPLSVPSVSRKRIRAPAGHPDAAKGHHRRNRPAIPRESSTRTPPPCGGRHYLKPRRNRS